MAEKLRRVGFLADTHSRKNDGSDVPPQVDKAFKHVDLIVHLGDVGKKAFIPRLQQLAPVWVPYGEGKGYIPFEGEDDPVKVIEVAGLALGLTFNLAQPDKKITVDEGQIVFPESPVADLLKRRFKQPVDLVAFGGTHRQHQQIHDGVLFFNPGSPTLPADGQGGDDLGWVAVLEVVKSRANVDLVRLHGPDPAPSTCKTSPRRVSVAVIGDDAVQAAPRRKPTPRTVRTYLGARPLSPSFPRSFEMWTSMM